MENVYKICFYGGLALAIIFLIVSVVLFFVLKIPKVINDLTGRTAKKQIDEIKKKKSRGLRKYPPLQQRFLQFLKQT